MENISLHAISQSLDLLKDTYNYNHWIYSLLRPFLGDSICEVGAGTGNLTRYFLNAARVVCIEPESIYCEALKKLAEVHSNLAIYQNGLENFFWEGKGSAGFDSVVCVNVLEHIEDDVMALRHMATMTRYGGRVLLYVPAAPWAYGRLDRQLGHFRRYSKRMIRILAVKGELVLEACSYVNFIGVFGWFLYARMMRREVISPKGARFIDRLVPYLSAVERLFPPLTGQSLFAVMRKP